MRLAYCRFSQTWPWPEIAINVWLTIKIFWHVWAFCRWKMEAMQFFITSAHLYQTARRHIPEDGYGHLHWHCLHGLQCLRNLSGAPELPPAASSAPHSHVQHVQNVRLKLSKGQTATPLHTLKTYRGRRGKAPLILNICITWISVGNFSSRPLYPR